MKNIKKYSQELDLNLHHLWLSLKDLQYQHYSLNIEKKLKEFVDYVEEILYKPIPENHDIIDSKCIYISFLEEFKSKDN